MSRLLFTISLIVLGTASFAAFESGFNKSEAKEMIMLCNSFTFEQTEQNIDSLKPDKYERVFTSMPNGFDNKFSIYKSEDKGVVCFRGSTEKYSSWVENMYSAMIPAKGETTISGTKYKYNFSNADSAGVHSGYSLSSILMSDQILTHIVALNAQGIHDIYITGHSQGGAIAILFSALLNHLPADKLSADNNFKVYAFANPMCGNEEFCQDYESSFSKEGMAISIVNSKDLVPTLPTSYNEKERYLSAKNMTSMFMRGERFNIARAGTEIAMTKFENVLTNYINGSNKLIEKALVLTGNQVVMPEYIRDINYSKTRNTVMLGAFSFPPKLNPIAQDSGAYQHKPYNYYLAVLRDYHPEEFAAMQK